MLDIVLGPPLQCNVSEHLEKGLMLSVRRCWDYSTRSRLNGAEDSLSDLDTAGTGYCAGHDSSHKQATLTASYSRLSAWVEYPA